MKLLRCPGCLETFDPGLDDEIVIADFAAFGVEKGKEAVIKLERYTAPDGKRYCCVDCFEINGGGH